MAPRLAGVLTAAILTMAILTMGILTMAILTMATSPWQPLLVVDPLTARTSAELVPLHNAIAIRVARHGPASNPSSPRPSPPSSPRPSAAPSLRSSMPSKAACEARAEAAAERTAIERAAVGCEVLTEWMAGRLDPAHPFLLDYARLHVGRQYREALIRMIGARS